MTTWEYRYIDLYRGEATVDAGAVFNAFTVEVGKAGSEGWEVVGEVQVSYRAFSNSQVMNVPVLMLKRQKST